MQDFLIRYAQIIYPLLLAWSFVWKGLSLWKAARKNSKIWFLLILVLNTMGLLEILYFFVLSKVDFSKLEDKFKKIIETVKSKFVKK